MLLHKPKKSGYIMEKIVLDKIPESYYYQALGSGASGNCFLMQNKVEVFKEFRAQIKYLSDLENLSIYKSDIFLFPQKYIFLGSESEENFAGYVRKAAVGIEFDSIDESADFNTLVTALSLLEKEIQRLTFEGLLVDDLNQGNLFYSEGSGFNVIDTDFYGVTYDDDFKHQYMANLKELSATVIHCMIRYDKFESEKLKEYIMKCGAYGRMRPSSLVQEFAEYIKKKTSEEVDTLGKFNKGMELIRIK